MHEPTETPKENCQKGVKEIEMSSVDMYQKVLKIHKSHFQLRNLRTHIAPSSSEQNMAHYQAVF